MARPICAIRVHAGWKKVHPSGPVCLAEVQAIDTPDPLTTVFHLNNPAPYLMKALSGRDTPIISKALFQGTEPLSDPAANKPIGTGPFRFVSWERGQSVRLDRNDKYWKPGLPYLNRVVARFIPDAATRSAAMETGGEPVSALYVPVQAQALVADIKARLHLSMLFVTHDLRVALQMCDRIAVMRAGRVVDVAPAQEIFHAPTHAYTRELLAAVPGAVWQQAIVERTT